MADFLCSFVEPSILFVGQPDGQDYNAVIMPFTAIDDHVAPTATAVTVISLPVSKADPLVIQVDDSVVIKQLVVMVKYPNGDWEGAYDGRVFSARYKQAASGSSTLVQNSSVRWTLTLRREGGWPFDPVACILAVDGAGNLS